MDTQRRDSKSGLNLRTFLVGSFLALITVFSFGQVSQIPREAGNYLSITGTSNEGDYDTVNVLFVEIPNTVTANFYIGIHDPGANDIPVTVDLGATSVTNFYVYGGPGALSHPNSQLVDYSGGRPSSLAAPGGTVIGTLLGVVSDNWEYIGPIDPAQGELIGNKRYFKVVAENLTAGTKDGYQVDISFSGISGTLPSGVSGARSFAFVWTLGLGQVNLNTWTLYPFVPEGAAGSIQIYTWDFDGGEGAVGPELSNIADAVQDPDIAISSDGLDFTYATINPDVDLVNPLADENRISVDNTLLGGSTNGTWKLVISETNGGEPGINSSEIWAGQGNGGTIWRIYSDYYVPAAADHVTITKEDGVAKSDDTDTETFTLQIVDATGNPVPYIQNVDVTATGAGTIRINGAGATATISTDINGLASFTVQADTAGTVNISLVTDGSGGSSNLPNTSANGTDSVLFQALLPVQISSAGNSGFDVSTLGAGLNDIVITDPDGRITSANNLFIRIPAALSDTVWGAAGGITFDTTGMAAPGFIAVGAGVGTDTLEITTTANFTPGDVLIIQNPLLDTGAVEASANLEISIDNAVTFPFTDDKIVSVSDASTKQWIGVTSTSWNTASNWSPAGVPGPGDDVVINNVANDPVLDIAITAGNDLGDLTIESGAVLTAQLEFRFGNLSNEGTLVINSSTNAFVYTGWDSDSGLVRYSGGVAVDLEENGPIDFWDLEIDAVGQDFNLGSNIRVANNFTITAGSLNSSGGTLEVNGNLSGAGTLTVGANNVTIDGDVTINQVDGGTGTITVGGAFTPGVYTGGGGGLIVAGGGVLPAGTYADLPISSGAFTLGGNITVTGDVTISGTGSLDVATFDMIVGGNWTNTAGPNTFNAQAQLVTFSGPTPTINMGDATNVFNNVSFTNAGPNITIDGLLTVNGTTRSRGTITSAGAGAWDFSGLILTADTIIDSTANDNDITITTVNSDTLNTHSLTIQSAGGDQNLGAFGGLVPHLGTTLSLTPAIVLPQMTQAGNLSVTSGEITQSGILSIGGTSSFDAGAALIDLSTFVNSFAGAVSLANTGANNVQILDNTNTVLGAVNITGGNLSVTSNGNISDDGTGPVSVVGTSTFTTNTAGRNIDLDNGAGFALTGNVTFNTNNDGDVALDNATTNINLTPGIFVTNADLTISTTGDITDVGNLVIPGSINLSAGGNITLDGNGDYGTITFSGTVVQINEIAPMVLEGSSAVTSVDLDSTGGITSDNDSDADIITPLLVLDAAGAVDIELNVDDLNASNTGAPADMFFREINGLNLVDVDSADGDITVVAAAGNITATDVQTTDGAITLTAGAGQVDTVRVTSGDAGADETHNISITANTDINMSGGGVNVVTADDLLALTATTGQIQDASNNGNDNFDAPRIQFQAATNIGVITADPLEGDFDTLEFARTTGAASTIHLINTAGDISLNAGALSPSDGAGITGGQAVLESAGHIDASTNDSISVQDDEDITLVATDEVFLPAALGTISTDGDYSFTGSLIRTVGGYNDFGTITADNLSLSGTNPIDTVIPMDVNNLTAAVTDANIALTINEANNINLLDVDTNNGALTVNSAAAGNITLTDVATAGGSLTVDNVVSGDITLVQVNLAGGNASFDTNAGQILGTVGGATDLIANNASFLATGAGSNITDLTIDVTNLAAQSGAGIINILDVLGGVNVDSVGAVNGISTNAGNITLDSNDGITLADLGAPETVRSTSGTISIDADADGIGLSGPLTFAPGSDVDAGSGVITLSAYDAISVTDVATSNASDTAITATSTNGAIVPIGAGPHFTLTNAAGRLVLDSNTGIADGGNLIVAVTEISVLNDANQVNITSTTNNLQVHGFVNNGNGDNTIDSAVDIRMHADLTTIGGTVDFNKPVELHTATVTMTTNGGDLDFNDDVIGNSRIFNVNTAGGDVNLTSGTFGGVPGFGSLTMAGANLNLSPAADTVIQTNNAAVNITAPINLANDRDLRVESTGVGQNVSLGAISETGAAAENVTIQTAGGTITLAGAALGDAGSVLETQSNSSVTFSGAVNVNGAINLYTENNTSVMTVGNSSAAWSIDDPSLLNITGATSVNIGLTPAGQTGNIILDGATFTNLTGAAIILETSGAGTIQVRNNTLINGSSMQLGHNVLLTADAEINTASGTATGDNIAVNGQINGGFDLTLVSGTAGDIVFDNALGLGIELGALTLTGDAVTFLSTLETTGQVTVTNEGTLTQSVGEAWEVDGGLIQNGNGDNDLGANITSVNSHISFDSLVDLQATLELNTGAVGGNIDIGANLLGSAAFDLTLDAGTGFVDFGGAVGNNGAGDLNDLTVFGTYAIFNGTDLYLDGNLDFTGAGYTRVNISGNATWDLAGASTFQFNNLILEFDSIHTLNFVNDNISAVNLAFFRGTWNPAGATIDLTGDLVFTGSGYATEDDPDAAPGNALQAYPDFAALGYPAPTYGAVFPLGALNGSTWNVGDDFFSHSMTLQGTNNWSLNLQPNAGTPPTLGSPFSGGATYNVAFDTRVAYSQVNGGYIASPAHYIASPALLGNTDLGNNGAVPVGAGWDFANLSITSAQTLSDDMILLTFNRPVENSGNEISAAVGAGRIRYHGGTLAFDEVFVNNGNLDLLARTGDSTNGAGDLTQIVVSNSDVLETWNTDANNLFAGDTAAPGISTDELGNTRNITVDLQILKYSLFDSVNKASLVDYGGEINGRYSAVADGAAPVLVQVVADREGTTGDEKSDHNFFNLIYSEPVDLDFNQPELQAGAITTNLRSTDDAVVGPGNYGGDIDHTPGTVTVEGFFSYPGEMQTGHRDGDTTYNSLYRTDTHSLQIYIVGWYDILLNPRWRGYIINATDPVLQPVTVLPNNDITDTSPLNNVLDHNKGPLLFNITAGGTPWDVDPPAFAPYLGPGTIREAITIDTFPFNDVIDHVEFHILDNSAQEAAWDSTAHPNGVGGIRDESIERDGFSFRLTGGGAFTNGFNIAEDSIVTNDLYTNSGPSDTDVNDPYFRIELNETGNPWTPVDQLDFEYDASVGFITDLAGNLLPSEMGPTYPQTIERTPPRVALSLAALGENQVYLRFSEVVFPNPPDPNFATTDFNFTAMGNSVASIDTYGIPPASGITEMVLTLTNPIQDTDFFGGRPFTLRITRSVTFS
jgi:hypothetical protein